ncbi:methyl-accepting chemotaxis protein [Herbaspirillum lusitanum]|uniref:Methyl-accepting chemotaxis protein n=1 Tax=Herbaspirillum lusitanum TaxID=213312 RepID=A0ABW9ABX9_9BURK
MFKKKGIAWRLGMAFGCVIAMVGLMTVMGTWRLQDIGERTRAMISDDLVNERLASAWAGEIERGAILTTAFVKSSDVAQQEYYKQQLNTSDARAKAIEVQLQRSLHSGEGKALITRLLAHRDKFQKIQSEVFGLSEQGRYADALEQLDSILTPAINAYANSVGELASHQRNAINQTADAVDASYRSGRGMLMGAGAAALLLAIFFAWRLATSVTRPLHVAVAAIRDVAAGNLNTRIEAARHDEIGILLRSLNEMAGTLLGIVRQVRSTSDAILLATNDIVSGNMDLSARTERQAGSLEETASATEELTLAVQQNAVSAQEANRLALAVSAMATDVGIVVQKVITTMTAINDSSTRIVDIIGVIDGIAFQTNILALNAAVEAARAGEQGRGFAVVAGEVRNLAQRSASAAREIKTLIGNSVEKVESGAALVGIAGGTMEKMMAGVKALGDVVAQISGATGEQSVGLKEINDAINLMDQMTQQNAALVEQAAGAATSLLEQANEMAAAVSAFQLGDDKALQPPALPQVPAPLALAL